MAVSCARFTALHLCVAFGRSIVEMRPPIVQVGVGQRRSNGWSAEKDDGGTGKLLEYLNGFWWEDDDYIIESTMRQCIHEQA